MSPEILKEIRSRNHARHGVLTIPMVVDLVDLLPVDCASIWMLLALALILRHLPVARTCRAFQQPLRNHRRTISFRYSAAANTAVTHKALGISTPLSYSQNTRLDVITMPPKAAPTDLPTQTFPNASDFASFLLDNHTTSPGIYLKLAKKGSGIPSITSAEAVETALCYGWIDGRANSIDEQWWTVRYTPRRKKSIWSKKNVDTVGRLIAGGKMKDAGLKCVEEAKDDGRWARAYSGPASIEVPEDFRRALDMAPEAKSFFGTLNRSERYAVLWRIETASPKTRVGRIGTIVEVLSNGTVPGAEEQKKWKPKAKAAVRVKVERSGVEKMIANKVSVVKPAKSARKTQGLRVAVEKNSQEPRRAGLRSRT